jgi:CBS domain-containing protein
LTDRDIAVRCVADRLDPDNTRLVDLMSAPVQSVDEDTPIEEAVSRMGRAGIRRLVVLGEAGNVAGVLSLDDILDTLVVETGAIGRLLERQKPRVPA